MKVIYFDIEIEVPKWTRFLATDSDGTVVAFEARPYYESEGFWALKEGTKQKELFRDFYYEGDWKKSLVEYEVIYEMSSDFKRDLERLINKNKMAWRHIIKICCYKDRTYLVDAQRDLFKHIDDVVETLDTMQRSFLTKEILKKDDDTIINFLTDLTEESVRKVSIESLVKEYRKEIDFSFIQKLKANVENIYLEFLTEYVRKRREITLKGFRSILQNVGVFTSGELNDIFRNHQDLLD